jgi:hypothetical protein
MPSLSGTGGRSSGVNYASASMYDRMYSFLLTDPNKRRSAGYLAVTYQADIGASGGSLKRAFRGLQLNN